MLNDKQSLILCGVMAFGIFIAGILRILDNFIVRTILALVFLSIVSNIFIVNNKPDKKKSNDSK